jgi:KDO2-lipid IV(A) lauroyltransferase
MLTLFRLLSHLPLRWLQGLGAGLGWLSWGLSPSLRRQFAANVAQAGVDPQAARAAIPSMGTMLAELPWLWLQAPQAGVLPLVRWDGAEHFERALDAGRGVILAVPHLGCWEMTGQALAEKYGPERGPLVALYRPARKAWLAPLVARSRERPGMTTVPTTLAGVRSLVKVLRRGGYTAILPDQVPPEGQGVWAPFFGRPAYTMTLLPRLAQQTGAAVLFNWCERVPGGGFVIHFEPMDDALLHTPGADPIACAAAVNAGMERLIRRCPGQYLWSYNRFKQPRKDD